MLKPYLTIQPINSASVAASRYVPLVLINRVLAFVRLLLVTRLLGDAGKAEFGLYQPSLELINWFVPLVLFGLGDVIERYAAKAVSAGQLHGLLRKHRRQLVIAVSVLLIAGLCVRPWVSEYLLPAASPSRAMVLVLLVLMNVAILAAYQYLLGLLRGLRAYGAAAGMETIAAMLLVTFSALAAAKGGANLLLIAYGISNLVPFLFYLRRVAVYCRALPRAEAGADNPLESQHAFAAATFVRLMLVMTYGYAVFWLVSWAMQDARAVAEFAAPWRVAQLMVYVAATLWSSTYGIMVGHWSRGSRKRAQLQLTRIGRIGLSFLLAVGCGVVALMPIWQAIFPGVYHHALQTYLHVMVCIFLLNGLLLYLCMWCDLLERPALGAALWASVLVVMAIVFFQPDAERTFAAILGAAWAGMAAAVYVFSWGMITMLRLKVDWRIAVLALAANLLLIPHYWGVVAAAVVATVFLFPEVRRHRKKVATKRLKTTT